MTLIAFRLPVEPLDALDARVLAILGRGPRAQLRCVLCRAWWTASGDLDIALRAQCPWCAGELRLDGIIPPAGYGVRAAARALPC